MSRLVLPVRVAFIVLVASTGLSGQTPMGPTGHWEGAIQVPGQKLEIEVDLARARETWEGTITIPTQGLKGFTLGSISVQGDSVSFVMPGVPGEPQFRGTLAKDGKTLAGEFTQGGGSVTFALTRTGEAKIERPPASTPVTKDLEGSWEGALDADGKQLRLVLKLSNQPDGTATGTLVSLDQGGAVVPVAAVVQTGAHLRLVVPAVAGNYEGDLEAAQLTGTWTQGPRTWPLVFRRSK